MPPILRRFVMPLFAASALAGTPLDSNFTDSAFVGELNQPTCIAWAPDGSNRLFVSLKASGIAVVENGQLRQTLFGTFPNLYTVSECGVLGLAFDPNYTTNRYVYVFVTVSEDEQQIARFTDQDSVGTQRTVILGNLPTAGINHDGGALGFGPDGKLYFAIGDNGIKRGVDGDLRSLASKVGRCNKDGTIPADNPFNDGAGPNNDYIWATGFRNPFTMTFQPGTGRLWLNVVGSTPDGQTQPRSGPGYEQIFVVQGGDDGGYDDYEGNQPAGTRYDSPFPRPLIRPRIQYKTGYSGGGGQVRQIAGAQRSGGTLSVSTTQTHPYRVGQALTLTGSGPLDGVYTVQTTPSATSFTVAAAGPALSTNSGQIDALAQGGCVTGGCFYTSSGFPSEYQGNLFYGDLVEGCIMRAELKASGKPRNITRFLDNAGGITDVAVGPDGALYYSDISSGTVRRVEYASQQGLVVSPTSLDLQEGSTASFTVRLGARPEGPVTVQVHKTNAVPPGEHEINLEGASSLIFGPDDWNLPQRLTLRATVDADSAADTAEFIVTAPGFDPVTVNATASDENLPGFVLSTGNLEVAEGKAANFSVALEAQPSRPVKVRVRPSGGQKGKATVVKGALLRFTPKNWNLPQTVRVRGDQDGNGIDQNVTLSIQAAGHRLAEVAVIVRDDELLAPQISPAVDTQTVVGLPYQFDVEAAARPAPVFSLLHAPEGMTIDSASGILTWRPPSTGSFPVRVQAENSKGADVLEFLLMVSADEPPTAFITQPQPGATISGAFAEFYGGSVDDYGTYKAEFYVDGQLVHTDTNREGHYHIHGAHNLFDTTTLTNGPHTLRMIVFDDKNQTGEATVSVTVSN